MFYRGKNLKAFFITIQNLSVLAFSLRTLCIIFFMNPVNSVIQVLTDSPSISSMFPWHVFYKGHQMSDRKKDWKTPAYIYLIPGAQKKKSGYSVPVIKVIMSIPTCMPAAMSTCQRDSTRDKNGQIHDAGLCFQVTWPSSENTKLRV